MHRAFAPVADRLDPGARAALVARLQILVGAEIALALHQAEAARIVVDEGADLKVGRVVERAPELLAAPVLDRKAVGVVHLGAEIVDAAAIVRRRRRYMLVSVASPICSICTRGNSVASMS